MAFVALGRGVELPVRVAVGAVDVLVVFVKHLTGHGVIERVRFPVAVTLFALAIQLAERQRLVTRAAPEIGVVLTQWPAGVGMVKRFRLGLALLPVTATTPVFVFHVVATRAVTVRFPARLGSLLGFPRFLVAA